MVVVAAMEQVTVPLTLYVAGGRARQDVSAVHRKSTLRHIDDEPFCSFDISKLSPAAPVNAPAGYHLSFSTNHGLYFCVDEVFLFSSENIIKLDKY